MSNSNSSVSQLAHDLFSKNQFEEVVHLATDDIQVTNFATGQVFIFIPISLKLIQK